MTIRLDELRHMTPEQLVDAALNEADLAMFWFILGALCGAISLENRAAPKALDELWATAYVLPRGDYQKAMRLLRAMKEHLARSRNPAAPAGRQTLKDPDP